ncbi:hypothetical protein BgiMline_015011 [Biomphalaria glabrata]|nr:uncharacterized protein LOC106056424 isoform X2 [Biomphalaria glabrata]XP_055888499.1 uncharacterized protein LOC106056424 isoform X2 [Biomphalaria glabrata]XP_055888500.1 uncharacterized protein LOC106056424 isoform X2 [Biomphalaria glabrata]XP_055888501.1 uncharacterized protein LOC106056424 isoform X2 [Biomphalaria glabrata]KAI8742354.1 CAunnamed protein product [Biomphalaria glabrata]KAI8752833.1 CAunnamed protein product [Biomphalaria glabrata]
MSICGLCLMMVVARAGAVAYDWHPPLSICANPSSFDRTTGIGPSFPRLPDQYSMKVEANILQKRWTTEVEEHYDKVNQRASRKMTFNGQTTLTIFDLRNGIRFTVLQNGSCTTESTKNDTSSSRLDMVSRLAIDMFNDDLRVGSSLTRIYVGSEFVRGIPVNHWTECETWPDLQAQFQVDYYFSDPDYNTASGDSQIPVRVVLNGSAHNVDSTHKSLPGLHTFYHIYDFTAFRAGPAQDANVFRIPLGVICYNRGDRKPLPALPDYFEVDVEVIIAGSVPHPAQEKITYDKEHQIVETKRSWLYPLHQQGDNTTAFTSYSVTTVEDFGTTIVFVNNEENGSCKAHMMDTIITTKMSHSFNLLFASNYLYPMAYQGKKEVRGLLVDAWGRHYQSIATEMYFLASESDVLNRQEQGTSAWVAPVGMLLRNGPGANASELPMIWEEILSLEGESKTGNHDAQQPQARPADDQIVWGLQTFDSRLGEKLVHFTHFKPGFNAGRNYDVGSCFSSQEKAFIFITVNASEYDLYENRSHDEDTTTTPIPLIKNALVKYTKIPYIQFRYMDFFDYFENTSSYFLFGLLGEIPDVRLARKLLPLKEIQERLQKHVQQGIYFYKQHEDGSKTYAIGTAKAIMDLSAKSLLPEDKKSLSPKPVNPATYSPQAVAGISMAMLVLGACICLLIVFILYRRRHPGQAFMFSKMTD